MSLATHLVVYDGGSGTEEQTTVELTVAATMVVLYGFFSGQTSFHSRTTTTTRTHARSEHTELLQLIHGGWRRLSDSEWLAAAGAIGGS